MKREDLDTYHNQLKDIVLKKKRIKYQINNDVRFTDTENESIEQLAIQYAKLDQQSKWYKDRLAADGEFIDWSTQDE